VSTLLIDHALLTHVSLFLYLIVLSPSSNIPLPVFFQVYEAIGSKIHISKGKGGISEDYKTLHTAFMLQESLGGKTCSEDAMKTQLHNAFKLHREWIADPKKNTSGLEGLSNAWFVMLLVTHDLQNVLNPNHMVRPMRKNYNVHFLFPGSPDELTTILSRLVEEQDNAEEAKALNKEKADAGMKERDAHERMAFDSKGLAALKKRAIVDSGKKADRKKAHIADSKREAQERADESDDSPNKPVVEPGFEQWMGQLMRVEMQTQQNLPNSSARKEVALRSANHLDQKFGLLSSQQIIDAAHITLSTPDMIGNITLSLLDNISIPVLISLFVNSNTPKEWKEEVVELGMEVLTSHKIYVLFKNATVDLKA
jgi:hypothetical protein